MTTRRNFIKAGAATAALAAPAAFAAPVPRRSLAELSSLPPAEKTQVMTLATPHLAQLEGVTQAHVASVVDSLALWQPTIVALERLPAIEVALLRGDPVYTEILDTYVGGHASMSDAAQTALGMSDLAASAEMTGWTGAPAELSAEERTRRLRVALAAFEMETALLYWRALGRPGEPGDGVSEAAVARMRELDATMNERVTVGVTLAERLKLPRLWSVDSHVGDIEFFAFAEDLEAGINALGGAQKAILSGPPYVEYDKVEAKALAEGDLEPVYRLMNSDAFNAADLRAQWDIYNREPFPGESGRKRLALWDERNMRIAANLRHATATDLGMRALFIVGAAHKPFVDALMAATLDIRPVDYTAAP